MIEETTMLHVAIDTPNGRWIQADFRSSAAMWLWIEEQLTMLQAKYGQHEWFKIRLENFTL